MHKQLGAAGIAGMALLLVPPAFGAGERVGVAAAVNQDASRTPPGASARTVILGDNLIFRERIETRGDGLVQILLVDGSTFTVGANSDLVIDEFVYDPDAGTGRLVASFGKGVARFVGGKLSKNAGGVTVKTPVGTIGIRGGIANLNVQGDESRFSLLFGDELSFIGRNGEQSRIYERGYTLSVAAALSGGLQRPVVRRTTQADISGVQRGLSGSPGQSGGAPTRPTDRTVSRSSVGGVNSGRHATDVAPRPKPQVVRSTNINESGHVTNVINRGANNDIVRRTDTPVDGSNHQSPSGCTSFLAVISEARSTAMSAESEVGVMGVPASRLSAAHNRAIRNPKEPIMGLFDKVKKLAGDNADKISEGVDKATDIIDEKTGGKHTDKLDQVDAKVDEVVQNLDGDPNN